jgi:transcriptional regulator with XRE-family HTH domain
MLYQIRKRTTIMRNHFAANVQKLRLKKGCTQTKLADDLIVNRPALGAWEENRAKPSYDKLIQIAEYFNITIDELLKTEL